jgi:hypothetical protein
MRNPESPHVGSFMDAKGMKAAAADEMKATKQVLMRGLNRNKAIRFKVRWKMFACEKIYNNLD